MSLPYRGASACMHAMQSSFSTADTRARSVFATRFITGGPCSLSGKRITVRMQPPKKSRISALKTVARDPTKKYLQCGVDFKIRRGVQADRADIFRLVVGEAMNPVGLDPERFWVAVDFRTGRVLGIVQLQLVNIGSTFHELRSMVVDREYRNCGVGRALVKEAMQSLPADEPVWLVTVPRAASFYVRHGFEPVYDTSELPTTIWFERFVGQFVAKAAGENTVVAMRRAGDAVRKTKGAMGYIPPTYDE